MPINTRNNDTYDRAAFINSKRRKEGIFSSDEKRLHTATAGSAKHRKRHDFEELDGDTARAH